jgi:hypothetical protein
MYLWLKRIAETIVTWIIISNAAYAVLERLI